MKYAWTVLFAVLPQTAHACAVCFGKSDNLGLIQGITWGIVVLLAFTFSSITGIYLFVRRIENERAASERRMAA
jgi:uncharacterized ion transporter superfamily protein YfcC